MLRVNARRAGAARARQYLAEGCEPGAEAVSGARAATMLVACAVALVAPAIALAGQTLTSDEVADSAGVESGVVTVP